MVTKSTTKNAGSGPIAGVGVDYYGGQVVDPTENVKTLTEAAVKRLDDLREAESRRTNEIRAAESRRIDEQAALRAEYTDRLATAEAKRIDAIRAVDVNAVAVASQRQSDQATVLASQVVQSAEALRSLVATTAAAQAQASTQITGALSDRITQLEKSSYEGAGKQAVADPMMSAAIEEMKRITQVIAAGNGQSQGKKDIVAYIATGISILVALLYVVDKLGK